MGLSTYSSDDRFLVEHTRHLGNWALRIKGAREEDEGLYECQITTHPPQSIFVELKVVGKLPQPPHSLGGPIQRLGGGHPLIYLFNWEAKRQQPRMGYLNFKFCIAEAVAEIIESPDLHINEGSTLRLECKLKRATESPLFVFW